jgi:hypothetical protein
MFRTEWSTVKTARKRVYTQCGLSLKYLVFLLLSHIEIKQIKPKTLSVFGTE